MTRLWHCSGGCGAAWYCVAPGASPPPADVVRDLMAADGWAPVGAVETSTVATCPECAAKVARTPHEGTKE